MTGCFTIPQRDLLMNSCKDNWKKTDNNMFACEFCQFKNKRIKDLLKHISVKHRSKPMKCAICPKQSKILSQLMNHLNNEHNKIRDKYHCSECEHQTYDLVNLKIDEKYHHVEISKLQCDYCHHYFSNKVTLREHIKMKHLKEDSPKLFKCTDCKYSTTNMFHLKGHLKRKHLNESTVNKCFYCPFKSISKSYLSVHIKKLHMKDKIIRNYTCKKCGFKCGSASGLKIHNFRKHSDRNKYIDCNICKELFESESACVSHKNTVHNSKPELKCNKCPYIAENKYVFHQHVKNHKMKFNCHYCNKCFKSKENLIMHIAKQHAGERISEKISNNSSNSVGNITKSKQLNVSKTSGSATLTNQDENDNLNILNMKNGNKGIQLQVNSLPDPHHHFQQHEEKIRGLRKEKSLPDNASNGLKLNESIKNVKRETTEIISAGQKQKKSSETTYGLRKEKNLPDNASMNGLKSNESIKNVKRETTEIMSASQKQKKSSETRYGDPSMTAKLLQNYPPLSDKEYLFIVDKLLNKPILKFPSNFYKCYSCSEVFTKLDDIKQHIISYLKFSGCFTDSLLPKFDSVNWKKLNNKKFKCKNCTYISESYPDIFHHLFDKHKLLGIKCAFCSENFEKIPHFLKHLKYRHKLCKDKYVCSICNYKTSAVVALRTHERQCHNIGTGLKTKINKEYKCRVCSVKCKNNEDLKTHMHYKHSRKAKSVKCSVCVQMFKTIADRVIHENMIHHFKHQYQCNNCSFIAENKISFHKHIGNHRVNLRLRKQTPGLRKEKNLHDNASMNGLKSNESTKNGETTEIISGGQKQKKSSETSYGVTLSRNKLLQKHPVLTDKQYRALVDNIIPKDLQFPIGDYKCYSCSTNFTKLEEWKQHIISYLKMTGCFTIPQQELLGNNLKDDWTKIDNNMFACKFCIFTTKYRQDVIQHILAKHRAIPLKCAICPNESNTLAYLLKHLNYKHNKIRDKYQCTKCDYQTYDSVSLRTHETINHVKSKEFQCKYCDYIFSTKQKWMKHTRVKHLGEKLPKLFKCTECKYSTTNMFYLKGHFKRKHVNEGVINECFYCPYKSISKSYLSVHIQKLHMKNEIIRNHTCNQCGFKCRTVTGLKNHTFYKHSDRNRYVLCNICKESFDSAAACVSHKNIVHDSKPELQCDQCSFNGEDKYTFHQHIENHHRKFFCAHCNKSARTKLLVLAHIINKHDPNARKYKCTKCPYRAKNRTLYLQHCNVKHNPNPILYSCYHCGHKNKIKHKLAQHMQTKHADILKGKKKNSKNNN